jgi:Holliday junction resolvasome RuvABC DNA-binding subunit
MLNYCRMGVGAGPAMPILADMAVENLAGLIVNGHIGLLTRKYAVPFQVV